MQPCCKNIVQHVANACEKRPNTGKPRNIKYSFIFNVYTIYFVDLSKLAIFATHKANSVATCLHSYAPACNEQIRNSIQACKEHSEREVINFIQSDYPNYARNGLTSVHIAFDENMKRASHLDHIR